TTSWKWNKATAELLRERSGESLVRSDDAQEPFSQDLYDKVSEKLNGRVAVKLLWDRQAGRNALDILPQDLMTAMVLQFTAAVAFGKSFRQCRECGKWFELAPALNRSSRFTCSNDCRKKSYRKRQTQARQLHTAGKSFREIAKELGSTVGSVKKWI